MKAPKRFSKRRKQNKKKKSKYPEVVVSAFEPEEELPFLVLDVTSSRS